MILALINLHESLKVDTDAGEYGMRVILIQGRRPYMLSF